MPELPEVETIVRKLRTRLPGQEIAHVQVRWPRAVAVPLAECFVAELVGRTFVDVQRRGKFIVMPLSPSKVLLVHLRMTGRVVVVAPNDEPGRLALLDDPHTHVVFELRSGLRLVYRDTRKFGRLYLVDDVAQVVGGLGPEPLADSWTAADLAAALGGRHRPLKVMLLDQHMLAGLGNIYTDEALWYARLHPLRYCHTLTSAEIEALWEAIRAVLACGIEHNGTTLRDYRDPEDRAGANQSCLQVYGRTGQPCVRCGTPIVRIVVGGRGTHLCPVCQQAPQPHEED